MLLLPLGSCSLPGSGQAVELALDARTEKETYLLGDPIWVTLTFKNTTPHMLHVEVGPDAQGAIFVYRGSMRHRQKAPPGDLDYAFPDVKHADLKPGETFQHKIFLNEWLTFRKPGEYRLSMRYDAPDVFGERYPGLRASSDLLVRVRERSPGDKPPLRAFELDLRTSKDAYMVGEPVWLTLVLRNTARRSYHIEMGHYAREAITVQSKGREHYSRFLDVMRRGGLGPHHEGDVEPGGTFEHTMLLNEWVMLRKVGRHRLKVLFDTGYEHFPWNSPRLRASQDIEIRVVEKDPRKLTHVLGRHYQKATAELFEKEHTLALCYSGQDETLPFLERLARLEDVRFLDTPTVAEIANGARRVGTLRALELLAKWMKGSATVSAEEATSQVFLLLQHTRDRAVRRRADELLKHLPPDYRPTETVIIN